MKSSTHSSSVWFPRLFFVAIMLLLAGCAAKEPNYEWFIVVSDHLSEEVTMRFCSELQTFVFCGARAGDVVHVISCRGHMPLAKLYVEGHSPEERQADPDLVDQLSDVSSLLESSAFVEGTEMCGLDLEVVPWTIARTRVTTKQARVLLIGASDRRLSYQVGCTCPNPRHSLMEEITRERFFPELGSQFMSEDYWKPEPGR